jgi:hypothetical protein
MEGVCYKLSIESYMRWRFVPSKSTETQEYMFIVHFEWKTLSRISSQTEDDVIDQTHSKSLFISSEEYM